MKDQKHEYNYDNIWIPDQLSQTIKEGIEKGKRIRRAQRRKRIGIAVGSTAAVLAVFTTYCFANPVFAAKLPLVGEIFARTEQKGEFPGDYSEHAEVISQDQDTVQEKPQQEQNTQVEAVVDYGDTDQNVTITPEEVFFDGSSLYVGLRLTTTEEAGFGQDILATGIEEYTLDYSVMQVIGNCSVNQRVYEFSEWLPGEQTAPDTFVGRLKVALDDVDENIKEIEMNITHLFWTDYNKREELRKQGKENLREAYIAKFGEWNLHVPVQVDRSQVNTVTVNDANEQGFGIESVIVTPYEIRIWPRIPELDAALLEQVYGEFQNKCIVQLGEEKAKQFLADTLFDSQDLNWYGGFAVFNQDGERMPYGSSKEGEEIHEGQMKKIEKLYFYLMPDGVTADKCKDQNVAEQCCIYSYTLDLKSVLP